MKESTRIAYTYAKHFLSEKFPDNKTLIQSNVHLHVPEVSYVLDVAIMFSRFIHKIATILM